MSEWSPKPVESLADSLEKLIGQIAQSLPANVATLDVKDDTAVSESGSVVLSPKRPSAARIHIDVDEEARIVFLSLGLGAVYEVTSGGHCYSDLSQLDEVRALCLAAVRGEFRETVWFKGDKVVAARGYARVGSAEVGDLWRRVFTNPLRSRRKCLYEYEPYD
jgi:hypothetical protein